MSEMINVQSCGGPVQVKTEADRPMLSTDFPEIHEALARAKARYERDRADYYNTLADEPILVKKTKRWQASAYDYMRWAGTLFDIDPNDSEQRQIAMSIMAQITNESGVRYGNMCTHADIKIALAEKLDDPEKKEEIIDRMNKAESLTGAFFRDTIKTQKRYIDLFQKCGTYQSFDKQMEDMAAVRIEELREKVFPKDRVYTPGRIIPPHRIPWGKRVPQVPDAYELYHRQPVDAYEFDYEEEEIVLKEGYVSPDGLIDSDSVKYDRKNKKCTIKYRGGVPVTWDYWKADNTADMPEPGSWTEEYLVRAYQQQLEDNEPGILRHRDYEDEIYDYDIIPGTNHRYEE